MSSDANLTPFSYVILALVGRNGAGPHDIVRMMREGAVFWTTSESHIYAEPKRLPKLGYLTAEKQPGRTRPRTHYELTDQGRSALVSWLAEPAQMPRVQNEAAVKLLAADFSDDATILASLSTLRAELPDRYGELEEVERRAQAIPHRTRYLRLLNELADARSTPSANGSSTSRGNSEHRPIEGLSVPPREGDVTPTSRLRTTRRVPARSTRSSRLLPWTSSCGPSDPSSSISSAPSLRCC
jgi:PadR family transcriptional regulator AphA